jgi:hypothetical protein
MCARTGPPRPSAGSRGDTTRSACAESSRRAATGVARVARTVEAAGLCAIAGARVAPLDVASLRGASGGGCRVGGAVCMESLAPGRCSAAPVQNSDSTFVEVAARLGGRASQLRSERGAVGPCFQLVSKKSTATPRRNSLETLRVGRPSRGFESHHPDKKPFRIECLHVSRGSRRSCSRTGSL